MFKRVQNFLILVLFIFMLFGLTGCKSTKVKEKEWMAAFSLESFSNCTIKCVSGEEGIADSERITIKIENNKYEYLGEEVYQNGEKFELDEHVFHYTDIYGTSWIYYEQTSTGNWVKETSNNYVLKGISEIVNYYKNLYFMFEYSDENKVYVNVEEERIHNVYFENGKLSEIKITLLDEYEVYTVIFSFKDYGKTKVTLPNV